MRNLYVRFDDSNTDPTYALADSALLVESVSDEGNPCVGKGVTRTVPVLPVSDTEVRAFADLMGWDVTVDADGRLLLRP